MVAIFLWSGQKYFNLASLRRTLVRHTKEELFLPNTLPAGCDFF